MSFDLIKDALTWLIQQRGEITVAFLLGVISTLCAVATVAAKRDWFLPAWLTKWLRRKDVKRIEELEAERQSLLNAKQRHAETVQELTLQLEASREENEQLDDVINEIGVGTVWYRSPTPDVPAFRHRSDGKPPIVAVVNLKGGVGKTTLTANLAATYWRRDRRVLVIDLDYQGSLTLLCLSEQQKEDAFAGRRYTERIMRDPMPSPQILSDLRQRIDGRSGWVVGTDEGLELCETQVMGQWLAGQTDDDIRFRLRRLLHSSEVQAQYDLILLDCPPRLTTACVNALAAADFVLIPVLPDRVSADAAPRLVRHLKRLKSEHKVCPDLAILGLVANKANNSAGLSSKQQTVWGRLPDQCRERWGEPVHQFATVIPRSAEFANAADAGTFAALGALQAVFTDLVDEIEKRMPTREGSRTPSISH